jgi:hypothetical protein
VEAVVDTSDRLPQLSSESETALPARKARPEDKAQMAQNSVSLVAPDFFDYF